MMARARSSLSVSATRVELGPGLQENGALPGKIFLGQRWSLATTLGEIGLDDILHAQVAAVGMAQKHQAHDRQEILVARIVGVSAQGVRRGPEAFFDGFYMFELRHNSGYCISEVFYHARPLDDTSQNWASC